MPGSIDERYLEFQSVMKTKPGIAEGPVAEIGEKLAG
jgi:hypothetical protein